MLHTDAEKLLYLLTQLKTMQKSNVTVHLKNMEGLDHVSFFANMVEIGLGHAIELASKITRQDGGH